MKKITLGEFLYYIYKKYGSPGTLIHHFYNRVGHDGMKGIYVGVDIILPEKSDRFSPPVFAVKEYRGAHDIVMFKTTPDTFDDYETKTYFEITALNGQVSYTDCDTDIRHVLKRDSVFTTHGPELNVLFCEARDFVFQ